MAGQNQTPNMDQFEAYFRRADLDQDGRISGAEAVGFFQGSNLSKQVLAQIWTYADQNRIGFLGRAEFNNALKLVTVAQSKRELTPDIVKAALYGPASGKIPAPQINLAATPAPQSNFKAGVPVQQLSSAAPTAPQSSGIRGPHGFSSQQTQFMRPPRPPLPSTGFQSQQSVASQGMPRGGTMAAPRPPSPNISSDWLGGRTGGPPTGVTSQVLNRSTSPSVSQDGFGLAPSGVLSSTQPRPQATAGLMQPATAKPNDQAFSVTGNGFASDSVFGDVFSVTSAQPKQDSLVSTSSAGALPVSSAPASGSQPTVKPSPLGSLQSTLTQHPVGSQHQQVHSAVKQNSQQVAVQSSSVFPVGAGNSATGQSQVPWPRMTQSDVHKYTKVFVEVDTDRDGKITGEQARNLFLSWRLPRDVLKQVWDLSDQDNDSLLSLREFCIALYLMERYREGRPLPPVLPSSTMFDETLFPASGQPSATYGSAVWRPTQVLQQPQGTTVARSVTPAGVRPSSPVSLPRADETIQPRQQKPKVPLLEKHLVDQLSSEEQNSLNAKFQEATEAEKKVEELEKEILDSKEKIQFYHTKMQEIILYKSRCDNRLNEISERVSVDKREAESLAKKYEEKYKQVGDVASKLTIEEATFRDIQEKKMELYRAIVKMEQVGTADGIQDNANRIQLELEELVRALNERCKTYGLRAKPISLVELPFGWQPGIQEGAADWDEDWDKLEDEGFTFVKELTLDVQNVVAPPKTKSLLVQASCRDEGEVAVLSFADGESEKSPSTRERIADDDLGNARDEDGVASRPPDSPIYRNGRESPSKIQDFPSRKSTDGDDSPHATETLSEHGGAESVLSVEKSFDEPGWGTFDTHDTEEAWDINPATAKDTGHERHIESSFFSPDDWGLNPIRTESTHTDTTFQNKSTFAFDSVPSTPVFNSGNSPHADNIFQKKSPFAFADSVPGTPMFNSSYSPRRFSEGSEDHSFDTFSRFDSFNMNDSSLFPPRESLTRFDSIRSTRDSEYDHGFYQPREALTRFDSMRSTSDSDYSHSFYQPPEFTRFDSMRSTKDTDYNHGFSSFDDADPFGSSDPFKTSLENQTPRNQDPFGSSDTFKTSLESQTPRRDSDSWRAF